MNVLNVTKDILRCVYFTTCFLKKALAGQNNSLDVGTREVLNVMHYSMLGLKSLGKSTMLKELRLQTRKVSFNTGKMFSPKTVLILLADLWPLQMSLEKR